MPQAQVAPGATPIQVFSIEFVPDADKGETKNTYRMAEVAQPGQPPQIGTLYLQKWIFVNGKPRRLRVTVEVLE